MEWSAQTIEILPICQRFSNDIHTLAEEQQDLEALSESFYKACTRNTMEISDVQLYSVRTKLKTNSANKILREIKVKEQK